MNKTLDVLNTKVGDVAKIGSLSKGVGNTIDFLGASRFMEVITMIGVLHNAFMLSNELGQTLFSIVDNAASIPIKIANPNGDDFDSKQLFSKSIESFFVGLFGKATYAEMVAAYKATNNIISTSSNLLSNVQNIIGETQNIQSVTSDWVRELGDALRDDGVISENNWEPKPEKYRFQSQRLGKLERMSQGIEKINNALQAIEEITSSVKDIVDTGNEIKENFEALDKQLGAAKTAASNVYDAGLKSINDALPDFDTDDLF